MDYESMSDFEINKAVAELQPFTNVVGDGAYPSISESAVHVEQRTFKYGNINELGVDYCNNPSDAWPIIVENRIVVDPSGHAWSSEFSICSDKNPLRAACIVYLILSATRRLVCYMD